jgi:hypothetical protein
VAGGSQRIEVIAAEADAFDATERAFNTWLPRWARHP